MLDIALFRADKGGNPDLVRESLRRRGQKVENVDRVIELDTQWRQSRGDLDRKGGELKALNKDIATKMKAKEDASELLTRQTAIKEEIAALNALVAELEVQIQSILSEMGNLVHESVPVSMDEKDNGLVKTWGENKIIENCHSHRDLIYMIDGADFERGAEVAGHSGYFFKGIGVQLNLALINYGTQFLIQNGYTLLQPPYFMNRQVMGECAQLSQFDEELYKVETGHETETKYLIATSEQPIAAFHRKEWIEQKQLPIQYAGWSSCFRKEAGGHGKEAWGLYRVHQFDKIEQFVITHPDKSWEMHEKMLDISEKFYQSLGLSYRVVSIVTGALNNAAAKKLDLEAWFPSYNDYRELVSCSNCTDYQSRRLGIRMQGGKDDKQFVHMLNSTLTATTRTLCCILENYQTPDGIVIPEVLRPFMYVPDGNYTIPYVNKPRAQKAHKAKAK